MQWLNREWNRVHYFLRSERIKMGMKVMVILALVMGFRQVFAADLLANTTQDMEDTLNGTGRKWLILIDFALASALYIKIKNVMLFLGVLVISIAITSILPAFLS